MPIRPYRIYLEVTRACPLQCLHCYADAGPSRQEEITSQDFENLIRQMVDMNIKELIISGGEPFLRQDILQLFDIALIGGLKVIVLTSGILINRRIAQEIKNYDIDLRLSLDGITPETHDFIRGKGNLEKVIEVIRILKEENIKNLSIHFTVNRMNIPEILKLPNFLFDLGIRDVVISTIKPAGRALRHPGLLIGPELMLLVRDRINIISKSQHLNFHVYKERNWQGLGCPAAHTKCGITSDGRITPCVFLGEQFEGENILNYPLKYLWQHDSTLNALRNISSTDGCGGCSSHNNGNGGCRARALYYNGSLNGVDPYCSEIERYQALKEN